MEKRNLLKRIGMLTVPVLGLTLAGHAYALTGKGEGTPGKDTPVVFQSKTSAAKTKYPTKPTSDVVHWINLGRAEDGQDATSFYNQDKRFAQAIDKKYGDGKAPLTSSEAAKFAKSQNRFNPKAQNNPQKCGDNIGLVYKNDDVAIIPGTSLGGPNPKCTEAECEESKPPAKPPKKIPAGYVFNLDSDGYPENIIPETDHLAIYPGIEGGKFGNKPVIANYDAVRAQILRSLDLMKDIKEQKTLPGEIMTIGEQGERVVNFMVETNDKASNTRLENAITMAALADQAASHNVRGEFKLNEFLTQQEAKFKVETTEEGKKVYFDSFGREKTPAEILLHVLGVTTYSTIRSDYNPFVTKNKSLEFDLGANMNANVAHINGATNSEELKNRVQTAYKIQKSVYEGQIKATKLKTKDLRRF